MVGSQAKILEGSQLEEAALMVFAKQELAPPLSILDETLRLAGIPARFGVRTAGDATDGELQSYEWEAVFLRWHKPQIHEVVLLERQVLGIDEEAEASLRGAKAFADSLTMSGGKLLIEEQLRESRVIYALYPLPALIADEDHPAWEALNLLLCTLATHAEGMIYALDEGFYDLEGEPMILEVDLTYDWEGDSLEEELEED